MKNAINWEVIKAVLKECEAIKMICNKGTANETIVTSSGRILLKYEPATAKKKFIKEVQEHLDKQNNNPAVILSGVEGLQR